MIQRLRDVLFYIVPRISPDGAETVLTSGRYVRSVTRDERGDRSHARWVAEDVNHDGLVLTMRQRDPAGEFIESATVPGWMLPRAIEDSGPFYKIYPEGVIENFDGVSIPEPHFLSDNPTDLNRNFPFSWMPEYEQDGAGEFPLSEPESRAVAAASTKLPHLFAWLNFHTFGGVFIRPLGDKPDSEMDQQDLALFKQIGVWATQYTGYPMVSGFEEFTYQPNKPLHGDMVDYAYHQRGCIAYVCELWDLFQQVGLTAKKPFIDTYMHLHRDDLVRIARWDTTENRGPRWDMESTIRKDRRDMRWAECGVSAGCGFGARYSRECGPGITRWGAHAHRCHDREPWIPPNLYPSFRPQARLE
jgi:hypothetical protein